MESCRYIIEGKKLKSFIQKYQPSHLFEISSDESIFLEIEYERMQDNIVDFIDIRTKPFPKNTALNSALAYYLIRYVIPSFYGLTSNPDAFAYTEEKKNLSDSQFKIIAHLREHEFLTHPILEDRLKSKMLLNQCNEYRISPEEMMLLPAIHALEVNILIYENNVKSRWYKQSSGRITSIKTMRALIEDIKKNIISRNIPFPELMEIFIKKLASEIHINLEDHNSRRCFRSFFKWRTSKLVEIYEHTLTSIASSRDAPTRDLLLKNPVFSGKRS
jgi:hypothetical protein